MMIEISSLATLGKRGGGHWTGTQGGFQGANSCLFSGLGRGSHGDILLVESLSFALRIVYFSEYMLYSNKTFFNASEEPGMCVW